MKRVCICGGGSLGHVIAGWLETKGLCLNVTYSFWSVFFALILSIFLPQYFSGALSWYIAIGSILILGGVTMATLYNSK